MRLAKLVAAGLVLGAAVGFVAALLRPRPVPYHAMPTDVTDLTDSADSADLTGARAIDHPAAEPLVVA